MNLGCCRFDDYSDDKHIQDSLTNMADSSELQAELHRALGIIDKTQLELFRHGPLMAGDERKSRVADILSQAKTDSGLAVQKARELLADVQRAYGDPYANYITPENHGNYKRNRSGNLVGIGIKFRSRDNDYPVVVGPLLGGPLDDFDVQPGDALKNVAGESLFGASARQVRSKLSGPAGSRVLVSLGRGESMTTTLEVERRSVELHYARAALLANDIAYIKISRFGTDTFERVTTYVQKFEMQGVRAYILDLRDNPGGSTRAARIIMSLFDDAAWVYCEQYKGGRSKQVPRQGEQLSKAPLAVLINERSMSSSEILAGALQVRKRALLVGTPSYGKGLIQKVYPLKSPIEGAVRTTIATYATPDNIPLHARGLTPDIYVPTAPHELYRETGSLNISEQARSFRASLSGDRLRTKIGREKANALLAVPDLQLQVAIRTF